MRSIGAVDLARLSLDQETIAVQVGVSRPLVSMWLSGVKSPGKANRAVIQREFGIHPDAWDREPPKVAPKKVPTPHQHIEERHVPGPVKTKNLGVFEEALAVMESVKSLRKWVDDPANDIRPTEKAKVLEKCVGMLGKLGKQTGETAELSEQKLVKSTALRKVLEVVLGALAKYPEALADVDRALQEVGE